MGVFVDITGQVFNRLTVLSFDGRTKDRKLRWLCVCVCGNQARVAGRNLRSGNTKSCGCLMVETTRKRSTIHGAAADGKVSPTHRSWTDINQRCFNPKTDRWKDYGGRGITVCERWRDFVNFLADIGERPDGQSIERLDNDAGYFPENCVWADSKTQARNRRSTKFVTVCGKRRPIVAACEEYGLNHRHVWERRQQTSTMTEAFFDVLERRLPLA